MVVREAVESIEKRSLVNAECRGMPRAARLGAWTGMLLWTALVGGGLPSGGLSRGLAQEAAPSLADHYGFGPLELYKLQLRSANLLAGDFNHDQRVDLVLVDNSNSRLDLLQQQPDEIGRAHV